MFSAIFHRLYIAERKSCTVADLTSFHTNMMNYIDQSSIINTTWGKGHMKFPSIAAPDRRPGLKTLSDSTDTHHLLLRKATGHVQTKTLLYLNEQQLDMPFDFNTVHTRNEYSGHWWSQHESTAFCEAFRE